MEATMDTFDLAYAKAHLEDLLDRAARGEAVHIDVPGRGRFSVASARADEAAVLHPERKLGLMAHLPTIPDDRLFAPLTEDELVWLSGETSDERS
jgi:antitoxin (DNA-binding transcriptional repressor) of toxin-antitoxin stability system